MYDNSCRRRVAQASLSTSSRYPRAASRPVPGLTFSHLPLAAILSNDPTLIGALCSQHFEKRAIAPCKTTNGYFQYLFEPWDCLHINFVPQGSLSGPTGPHLLRNS